MKPGANEQAYLDIYAQSLVKGKCPRADMTIRQAYIKDIVAKLAACLYQEWAQEEMHREKNVMGLEDVYEYIAVVSCEIADACLKKELETSDEK